MTARLSTEGFNEIARNVHTDLADRRQRAASAEDAVWRPVDETSRAQREAATETGHPPPDGVILTPGADIRPEPIAWLWDGWLARGKLHVLAGAPGQGKTTIALAFAATLTRGGRWPDGSLCQPGNVLIWSGEDDPADTLVPRLIGMDADMTRVFFITGSRIDGRVLPFDPARDIVQIAEAARRIGGVRLLVVDPLVLVVMGDSHKNTEVRRDLQPLVDLASCLQAAAIGITHLSKSSAGRDPIERVTGSIDFSAVARVVLLAARDKDRRILVRAKSNIGPDEGGFIYRVEQTEARPGIQASVLTWGEAIEGNARELLAEAEAQPGDDEEQHDAVEWLRELLRAGPTLVSEIKKSASAHGHAWRTVQRSMRRAGAQSRRVGFGKPAEWFLAATIGATSSPFAPLAPHPESGANGANGVNGANGANDVNGANGAPVERDV